MKNFNTKYKEGFIQSEIDELLKKYPTINMDKFNNALRGTTYTIINNENVTYPIDIIHAIKCGMENRNLNNFEWD
jgi:hypothetical protein